MSDVRPMRILVTGSEGQIARSLRERAAGTGHDVVALGRPSLDLAGDSGLIAQAIRDSGADVVVSAAAYTAVDKAEGDQLQAEAINVRGAAAVADGARQLKVPLIHVSTDYVFNGEKTTPYVEEDVTSPVSVYGHTKRDGEQAVLAAYDNVAIVRTAWVYSPFGSNFVKTILRLASERDEIGVVADQRGNPSSALDLADGLIAVAANLGGSSDPALRGIFHMAGQGEASWADFAATIIEESARLGGPSASVRPIPSSDYPTPAARPFNSRLDCSKIKAVHGVVMPDWKMSVAAVIERLVGPHSHNEGTTGA